MCKYGTLYADYASHVYISITLASCIICYKMSEHIESKCDSFSPGDSAITTAIALDL
jgi:hypothetical protein